MPANKMKNSKKPGQKQKSKDKLCYEKGKMNGGFYHMAPQKRWRKGRREAMADRDTHLCRTTCLCFSLHSDLKVVT
jgi:hypothetical protein